jgi:hypothetical protein
MNKGHLAVAFFLSLPKRATKSGLVEILPIRKYISGGHHRQGGEDRLTIAGLYGRVELMVDGTIRIESRTGGDVGG